MVHKTSLIFVNKIESYFKYFCWDEASFLFILSNFHAKVAGKTINKSAVSDEKT
nr:MAG TPA: hypothetical protein [Caudoviricetes sp.]